ncbi:MAG: carboxypeptidase regulatory-like domain-containing protein [Patescibacteria group bacterium]
MKRWLIIIGCAALLSAVPGLATAATMYVSPSTKTVNVGDSFTVTIGVNTGGVAINSAQATVSYPANLLEATGISSQGIFTLWAINPSYSNASGTATFAGGLPSPGYTGASGTAIGIVFRAKAQGSAKVTISGASILANDGLGTDVFSGAGSGTYTINTPSAEPTPTPTPTPTEKKTPSAPTISSTTHKDQTAWYSDKNPAFSWTRESGVTGFSTSLDDKPTAAPDTDQDTNDNSQTFTGTGDGTWYFHVRAKNNDGWGPAGYFKINIDATPPDPFTVELLDGEKTTSLSPRLNFETKDALSGLKDYMLSVNGGPVTTVATDATKPYTLAGLGIGEYTVTITANDNAGNSTTTVTLFSIKSETVEPPPSTGPEQALPGIAKSINSVLKSINNILPDSLQKTTKKVSDAVNSLRKNEGVTDTFDNVIRPTVTTTAIITVVGVATTSSALQLTNLLYLFLRFSYLWMAPIHFGKKRRPWGIVFDSTTGRPIPRALVRVFAKEFNKLKESQVTDAEGRFGFLISPGEYFITAGKAGFTFPSKFLRSAIVSQYEEIYRGGLFTVGPNDAGIISINIPVDPILAAISQARMKWLRILNTIGLILEKISTPLLIAGSLLSLLTVIIEPWSANFIILGVYILLIFIKSIMGFLIGRSWGLVVDEDTGKAVELAVVRIYDANTGNIMGTRVTNNLGQFTSFIMPGEYYVVILKQGYEPFRSKPITVTKRRGLIRMKAELVAKDKIKGLPEGEEIINLESVDRPARIKAAVMQKTEPMTAKSRAIKAPASAKSTDTQVLDRSVFKPPPLMTPQKKKRTVK